MESQMRNKLWQIAGGYLADDLIHGLPHIKRVDDNFQFFLADKPRLNDDIADALQISVILHDIGRSAAGQGDHAVKSAEIMKSLFRKELSGAKNQDWIIKAVSRHSIGLERKIKDEADTILALLCVFDHIDSIGAIGIHRLTLYWCGGQPYRIPWIPAGLNPIEKIKFREKIESYLSNPQRITRKDTDMRANSLVECLTYHFAATYEIIGPVEYTLGKNVLREIQTRLNVMKQYTSKLSQSLLI